MNATLEKLESAKALKIYFEKRLDDKVTYIELEQVLQTGKKLRADSKVPEYTSEELEQFTSQLMTLKQGPRPVDSSAIGSVPALPVRPVDEMDAGILATELGASLTDIFVAAGVTDLATASEFTKVSRQAVIDGLRRRGDVLEPEIAEDEGTMVIDDGVLRGNLVKTRRFVYTKEDRKILKELYAFISRWFNFYATHLVGEGVWREVQLMEVKAADGVTSIAWQYPTELWPGHFIRLTPAERTELEFKTGESYPVLDDWIINELLRKLASLSTLQHVCARCGTQLPQPLRPKLEMLLEGQFALPTKGHNTKARLEALGLLDPQWLDSRGRLPEIRFRQVHLECKVIGRLVDELVQTMRAEGADLGRPECQQDFVERAEKLLQVALQELSQHHWVTREQVAQRLVDIVNNLTEEDIK